MEGLRKSLENLHNELKKAESLDEESREMLRILTSEIQEILDRSELTKSKKHQRILANLQQSAQKFELTHPELAGAINIVINGLTSLGI